MQTDTRQRSLDLNYVEFHYFHASTQITKLVIWSMSLSINTTIRTKYIAENRRFTWTGLDSFSWLRLRIWIAHAQKSYFNVVEF